MAEERKNTATVDGVRAIEMRYRAIWSADEKLPAFYQSSIRLNSPDMGVLLPEQFLPALEADDKGISVFKLALLQTIRSADKFTERELDFDWVSVFIPHRLLKRSDCVKTVRDFTGMLGALPKQICFELPYSVMDERDSGCCEAVKQLRKAGYHTMLTGVDGEHLPLFRLAELEAEYIAFSEKVTARLGESGKADSCIESLMSFVSDIGSEPIASGVSSAETADALNELGCSYFIGTENGEFSGKFAADRFIRRKTASADEP